MKKLFWLFLVALSVGVAWSETAVKSAFLFSNRPATVSVNASRIATTCALDTSVCANDGMSWYAGVEVKGTATNWTNRILLGTSTKLSTSLTGYFASWTTYANAPSDAHYFDEGPSSMTKTLSETGDLELTSSVVSSLYSRNSLSGVTDLYVCFTPITYNVKYEIGEGSFADGSPHPETATYDVPFVVSAPTRDYYTFAGWRVGNKTFFNGVSNDVTFVNLTAEDGATVAVGALWTANNYPLQLSVGEGIQKIHYRVSDSSPWLETTTSDTVQVDYGEVWSAWAEAAYGYKGSGSGWDEASVTSGTMSEKGDKFAPEADKSSFTLKVFASPGGSVSGSGTYTYGDSTYLTAVPESGYRFVGWSDGTAENPYYYTLVSNATLTAAFESKKYELQLIVGEGVAKINYQLKDEDDTWSDWKSVTGSTTLNLDYGTGYRVYAEPANGYSLTGSGSSQGSAVSGTLKTDGFIFEPKPTANSYTVVATSDPADGIDDILVQPVGKFSRGDVATVKVTAKAGYSFVRWDRYDGNVLSSGVSRSSTYSFEVTNNVSLVAILRQKSHTVRFVYNLSSGDEFEDVQTVAYGESAVEPSAEKRNNWPGHTFVQWSSSDWMSVTKDMEIRAVYGDNEYTVRFNANGGSGSMSDQTHTYGKEQSLRANAFSRTGYAFAGWSVDATASSRQYEDEQVVRDLTTSDSITLYAIWDPISYTIQFTRGAAQKGDPFEETVKYDAAFTMPACPYEYAVSFSGWYDASTKLTYAAGEVVQRLASEEGARVTLVAQYGTSCQVRFHANYTDESGHLPSHAYETQLFEEDVEDALKANNFTRTGYTFAGWSVDAAADANSELVADQALLTNPAEVGETLNLYAIWIPNTYQVVFDGNGNQPGVSFLDDYNEMRVLTNDCSYTIPCEFNDRIGNGVFAGWSTTTNSADLVTDATGGPIKNLTTIPGDHIRLYAIWKSTAVNAKAAAASMTSASPMSASTTTWTSSGWTQLRSGVYSNAADTAILSTTIATNGTLTFAWHPSAVGDIGDDDPLSETSLFDESSRLSDAYLEVKLNGAVLTNLTGITSRNEQVVTVAVDTVTSPATLSFETSAAGESDGTDYEGVYPVMLSEIVWTAEEGEEPEDPEPEDPDPEEPDPESGSSVSAVPISVRFAIDGAKGCRIGGGAMEQALTRGTNSTGAVIWRAVATEPTVVGTNGWDFAGWSAGANGRINVDGIAFTNLLADTTFTAVFTPHVYDIRYANAREHNNSNPSTFASTNGVLSAYDQAWDGVYQPLSKFDTEGGDTAFDEWSPAQVPSGVYHQRVDPATFTYVYTNVVTQARWKDMIVATDKVYTVTFVSGEGDRCTNTVAVQEGKGVTNAPVAEARRGYVFAEWDKALDGVKESFVTKAKYTLIKYPVTYANLLGETHDNPSEYDITDVEKAAYALHSPKVDNANLRFVGWAPTNCIPRDSIGALAYTAQWAYRVTFQRTSDGHVASIEGEDADGALSVYVVAETGSTNVPPVTCDPGYSFAGWSVDGGVVSNVTEATTLYAVATANVYRVEFDGGEGATGKMDPQTFVYDEEQALASNRFAKAEHSFAGWSVATRTGDRFNDGAVVKNLATGGVVRLVAEWKAIPKTYTVTYVAEGGVRLVGPAEETVEEGGSVTLPSVELDKGYAFAGWHAVSNNTADVTYYAVATACVYAITYEGVPAGMANPNPTEYTVESNIVFAALSARADGAPFAGWTPAQIESGSTGDVRVVSGWGVLHKIEVKVGEAGGGSVRLLDAAGVEIANGGHYLEGTNLVAEATADEGWAFVRWDVDAAVDACVDDTRTGVCVNVCVNGAVALTAIFEKKTYVVTFELDEHLTRTGGGALEQAVEHGGSAAVPTVEGIGYYALEGWYDERGNSMDAESLGNVTASANYQARSVSVEPYIAADVAAEYETKKAIEPIDVRCVYESAATLKVTGLPSGLKFAKGQIYGTPTKSGLYTATVTASLTQKVNGRNVTTVLATKAIDFVIRKAGESIVRAYVNEATAGKVTGQGVYAAGKKVTLKATAAKGYVFSGWWRVDEDKDEGSGLVSVPTEPLSRTASYAIVVPSEDVSYEARFISSAQDAACVSASVNGLALVERGTAGEGAVVHALSTNVSAGVYLEWPLAYEAESAATVAVSGLPSGLKFTAKPVTTKTTATVDGKRVTTVVTNVPANTIYGTPTAGGKTSTVKVTVTTAGKNRAMGTLQVSVEALPAALVGTYVGGAPIDATVDDATAGSATVTLAKTGKISGKWVSEGKTWSLTANNLDSVDAGVYTATATAKCGKESETLTLSFSVNALGYGTVDATPLFTATYVPWKTDADLKTLAKAMKGKKFTIVDGGATFTGTVGANGAVTVKGSFDVGATNPYTANASGTLVPVGDDTFELFLYYPPKSAKNFAGCGVLLKL